MSVCKPCSGSGELTNPKTKETSPCPYCNGTGDFISLKEPTAPYFMKTSTPRTSFPYSGRYAGTGIDEDDYGDNYAEPRYRLSPFSNDSRHHLVEDGTVSEVKVMDEKTGKHTRTDYYIFERSKSGKSGKWKLTGTKLHL